MAGRAENPGKSVTSRALNILAAFDAAHSIMTLSEISRRSGTPVATCHRLLTELVQWGALVKTPSQQYQIGHRIWSLGMLAPVQRDLREVAAPYMHDVLFATRQVVNLFVLEGTKALVLERISGTAVGRPIAKVGDRMALHASAGGKVLLAYAPAETAEQVFANLTRETRHTIVEPGRLMAEIHKVRDRGYAVTVEEHALGTSGLAVPVLDSSNRVLASLGVVFMGAMKEPERIVPALQVAASAIARDAQTGH